MAKDYAKRHTTTNSGTDTELPRWGWFSVGFIFGLFAAFLIYLWQFVPADEMSNIDKPTAEIIQEKPFSQDKESQDKESQGKGAEEEFTLDFYDLFPKQEVPVVEQYNKSGERVRAPDRKRYALQVGSFKIRGDADRLRGELILMGLKVHIRSIKDKAGLSWHRVIVGPIETERELSRTRTRLAENKIESLTLRVK